MSTAPRLSFEFFPPKTPEGHSKLMQTVDSLATLVPAFFSVTYGAGGSTRDNTRQTVQAIRDKGHAVAPHLSFGNDDADAVLALLQDYRAAGVQRIVALRGDLPSGQADRSRLVYARDLVAFIREHTGDHFHLEVAAYPEIHPDAPGYSADVRFLKAKLDAGADSAITQYFYSLEAYQQFLDACDREGIRQPIYPGIMPITNVANLLRFSSVCGADIPRWLRYRLDDVKDDAEAVKQVGIEIVTRLCEDLLDTGAPGLHFYTMNQAEPTTALVKALGLR